MRTLILSALAATLCAAPAMAQTEAPAPAQTNGDKGQISSPDVEKQIVGELRRLAENLHDGKVFAAQDSIYGSRSGFFGASTWINDFSALLQGRSIIIRDAKILQRQGDEVKASVVYSFGNTAFNRKNDFWKKNFEEVINLKRAPSVYDSALSTWKLVPSDVPPPAWVTSNDLMVPPDGEAAQVIIPPATPFPPRNRALPEQGSGAPTLWANVAYYLTQTQTVAPTLSSAELSMSHLKLLSLAVVQLAQLFDDTYALDPRYQIEALNQFIPAPTSVQPTIFQVPDTNEIYQFNGNLSGLKTNEVKTPAQTVLFYEGRNETPVFRYDGRAAICFTDGHVALVSPEEAKDLIWKP